MPQYSFWHVLTFKRFAARRGNRDGGLQREELRKLLQDLNDGMDVDDAEVDYASGPGITRVFDSGVVALSLW